MTKRLMVLALSLAVAAAACGTSSETTTTAGGTAATAGDAATTTTSATTPTDAATTTTEPPTTTTVATTTTTTLPGTPIDFFPEEGDVLSVVGVAHDDMLNVRVAPGITNAIVDRLEPTGTVAATGKARDLGLAIWVGLDTGDAVGWSNYQFLAYAGNTDDATAEVVVLLGEVPTADSMAALGLIVAGALASTDPPSRIVLTVAPTVGDIGEVTYDVIGIGDDAVKGYRLHVFGEPVTDGFSLRTVERIMLCGRGVDDDGLCV